ncbi:Superfamily II DNA and RNA helicase [Andreprevotia lacus DSM 23236]|jgi:ATP-dependent RNA helicase RhlE|uniref:DEAD-box ATP-dependent RNA helicase RhpA n=1 Tax=Andreprevotia lacus DSM 23236 TaxID=1121001 RepID=A0A1W1Y0U8_9NEIS|nr:DEAD/DEAH box helicase [Andreprevotia lacus]SMC29762.1 Superfamily II DNA and RNA helicase [Andreprevotia lacus DSM 23236]
MTFSTLGLAPEVLRAVADTGYENPTPIQAQAIPLVLAGRDVLGAAQTGTGKTAAFTLPILSKLAPHANTGASPARHPVRALVLTPTRELADQVFDNVKAYGKHLALRPHVVFGGVDIKDQTATLRAGVEVLVATPGRLLDHVQQKNVNLSQVEILVLDEADRMLDMGFILDIKKIIGLLTNRKQTLLFSATFSPEIKKLASEFLTNPALVEVARQNATNENVEQLLHPCETFRKPALLAHLIRSHAMSQVIVFNRTKQGADTVARALKRGGFDCEAIHGDRDQRSRMETLERFKAGTLQILVATDVAARGLDISELPFVVNFELPNNPEDYVHRIGRTGRAGAKGVAISLVDPGEDKPYALIQKLIKKELPLIPVPGFSPGTEPLAPPPRPERSERNERNERSREHRAERSDRPAERFGRHERAQRQDNNEHRTYTAAPRAEQAPRRERSRPDDLDIPTMPLIRKQPLQQIAALFLPPRKPAAPKE